MLAITLALPTIGWAIRDTSLNSGPDDASAALAISGAVMFFPMQILTDVLGSRALHHAQHVLRSEAI
jgi:hypothetical protein